MPWTWYCSASCSSRRVPFPPRDTRTGEAGRPEKTVGAPGASRYDAGRGSPLTTTPMSRPKPALAPLHALTPGQHADFFALLSEKTRGATRDGKPFYTVRFRDARRSVTLMAWADGRWYEPCERDWQEGQFYKLRATYGEHERYGPQI